MSDLRRRSDGFDAFVTRPLPAMLTDAITQIYQFSANLPKPWRGKFEMAAAGPSEGTRLPSPLLQGGLALANVLRAKACAALRLPRVRFSWSLRGRGADAPLRRKICQEGLAVQFPGRQATWLSPRPLKAFVYRRQGPAERRSAAARVPL